MKTKEKLLYYLGLLRRVTKPFEIRLYMKEGIVLIQKGFFATAYQKTSYGRFKKVNAKKTYLEHFTKEKPKTTHKVETTRVLNTCIHNKQEREKTITYFYTLKMESWKK